MTSQRIIIRDGKILGTSEGLKIGFWKHFYL